MQPIFFVMAILGCGDGNVQCTETRVVPAQYSTMQQCRADLPTMLARNTDIDFPVVSATCRANGSFTASAITPTPRG